MKPENLIKYLKSIWQKYTSFAGAKAVHTLEWEASELEHIFAIITLGAFIGLPAPPMSITLNLLPDMENDLVLIINKMDISHAPLSELFSVLDMS
jgi:hypothetical protein